MSKTIYLYLKTHNVTGLKYLGKTVQNPYEYMGSGKRWKSELNKYGIDVTTEILFETKCKEEFKRKAVEYSHKLNIVESTEFANYRIEEGDGGDTSNTEGFIKAVERNKANGVYQRIAEKRNKTLEGRHQDIARKSANTMSVADESGITIRQKAAAKMMDTRSKPGWWEQVGKPAHERGLRNRDNVALGKVISEALQQVDCKARAIKGRDTRHAIGKSFEGGNNPKAKSVCIDDKYYSTMKEASEKTGLSLYFIRKMVNQI